MNLYNSSRYICENQFEYCFFKRLIKAGDQNEEHSKDFILEQFRWWEKYLLQKSARWLFLPVLVFRNLSIKTYRAGRLLYYTYGQFFFIAD